MQISTNRFKFHELSRLLGYKQAFLRLLYIQEVARIHPLVKDLIYKLINTNSNSRNAFLNKNIIECTHFPKM